MKHQRFSKELVGTRNDVLSVELMFPTALAYPTSLTALAEPLVPQLGLY